MTRDYDGEICEIKCKMILPLRLTPEHPVYVMRRRHSHKKYYLDEEPSWIKAKDVLSVGTDVRCDDFVGIKINREFIESDMTHGQARLLGYYLAEGSKTWIYRINRRSLNEICVGKKVRGGVSISFAFHVNEHELIDDVQCILRDEFGVNSRRYVNEKSNPNCCCVCCSSVEVAEFIERYVGGEKALVKRLSDEAMMLPNDLQAQLLEAYWNGDGSLYRNDKNNLGTKRYHTSSKELAVQVQMLLLRQGIFASILLYRSRSDGKRFSKNPMYEVSHPVERQRCQGFFYDDDRDIVWFLVSKVKRHKYCGPVYNFSVTQFESYMLAGGIVHNCVGRVCRTKEGKRTPFVLDYVDMNPKTIRSFKSRLRLYEKLGWKIHGLEKIGNLDAYN
jgi:hypothetical protein